MRIIKSETITQHVKTMCFEANCYLNKDVINKLKQSEQIETGIGKDVLNKIIENSQLAKDTNSPMCQDTGMVVAFVEIGNKVFIEGDTIEQAINKGVRIGYEENYLRKSVVSDPIIRVNTNDNTPSIIHYEFVEGENITIHIMPKGFGSENKSRLKMLNPSDGIEGVKDFVIETVKIADCNPCPPIVVGVGIGGDFEKAAIISKKALLRNLDDKNETLYLAELEDELLEKINNLHIGAAGFGGITTAIGVKVETYPTHIAGLPVAVNICCHAIRHKSIII